MSLFNRSFAVVLTVFGVFSSPPAVEAQPAAAAESAVQFNTPWGVATDSSGNVYVTDTLNHAVRMITPAGVVTTVGGLAGTAGSSDGTRSAARFNNPLGIATDSSGNIYVAETNNQTIRKITPVGVVTTLAGLAGHQGSADGMGSAARFGYAYGVTTDSSGNVYVADAGNNTIRKITSAGVVTTLAGRARKSGSADGTGSAARFNNPNGVATDSSGNVYVADRGNNTIRTITPAGAVTTLAGLVGTGWSADGKGSDARFDFPQGVATDSSGNVYVGDTNDQTIRKITPAGEVTTWAGGSARPESVDGMWKEARFNWPQGVATDKSGNVYVADANNQAIRKITPAGAVTTLVVAARPQQSPPSANQAPATDHVRLTYQGRQLTADSARSLEDQLKQDPEDLGIRAQLLGYYFTVAKRQNGAEATVAARRRHILWLIEHHPESQLAGLPEATLDISGHDLADAAGYEQARQLWMRQMETKDARILRNAAFFFKVPDKVLAEKALLRLRQIEPANPENTGELAFLYTMSILGVARMTNTGIPTGWSPEQAHSDFARATREKVEKSSDADLVAAVGSLMGMQAMMLSRFAPNFPANEYAQLAERLLVRARELNPEKHSSELAEFYELKAKGAASPEERLALQKKAFAMLEPELARKRDPERLQRIATLALEMGETHKAETYSRELLEKSAAVDDANMRDEFLHKANILVGRVDLRNGNVAAAKQHLLAAGQVNGGVTLTSFGPNMSLAKELLEKRERDTVVQYLDLCARFWTSDYGQLAKWKSEIRAGRIPNFGANLIY